MIAEAVRRQIREVHDFFADVIRRGQAAGVIHPDRDPVAEAWIFIAGGLLATIDHRLGGLLGDDLERVRAVAPAPGCVADSGLRAPKERAPAAAPGALSGQAGRSV